MAHAYRRRGVYKIEVQNYYAGGHGPKGWYDFDAINVAVGPLPAYATWMKATTSAHAPSGSPTPVSSGATPTPTPTPLATGGAG